MFGLSALTWLLIGAAIAGVIGLRLNPSRRAGVDAWPDWLIDALWMLALGVAGVLSATAIHSSVNPNWYPVGQDWREFVVLALDIQSGGMFHPVPQRYPFYAWLAVELAEFSRLPVHIGLMQLNIVAGGLLPAVVFRLGTAIGPRSLAVAGGWLALFVPTVASTLGPPTDYLFHGAVHILAMSAGIRALRSGGVWRWLGFGFALALLMATTMKSLVFLLIAAPLVALALFWQGRSSPKLAGLSLAAWLAPMMLIWSVYSTIPRWVTEAYSLEYNVYRTQVVVARAHGRTAPLPTDLGWHESDEKRRGYWGVGRPGAWSNIDKVLTFLARGPKHNLPAHMRWQGATEGLSKALHLPSPAWLLLGLIGCLAPIRRRASDTHLGPVLAVTWLTGITLAHFMGLMSTHFIPRYAIVLLIPGPLLLLLGVMPWRAARTAWLVPIGAMAASLWASSTPGWTAIYSSDEAKDMALNPHHDFWAIRDELGPQDTAYDMTGNRILSDLWATSPVSITSVPDEETHVRLPGQKAGRRILVLPGALNMGDSVRKWKGATVGRLKELRPYVFEDTEANEPLDLKLAELEP